MLMNMIFLGYFQSTGDEETDNIITDKFYRLGYWVEPDYCWEENCDEDCLCLEMEINIDKTVDRL
ncbi:MAG: hypothetical protein ACOX7J_01870 [Bacillota bacterium]|jgi:hypothetical protein